MDNFQIETAQNVTIYQNAANIGERILAYIIDTGIIIIYIILVIILFASINLLDDDDHLMLFFMTMGLPPVFYHLLFETFWNGQSIGKKIMKIRVVKLDGSQPAFSNYLLRWLMRTIDVNLGSGVVALVTILINGKGQRLGDIAAATTVISEKTPVQFKDILVEEISNQYQPQYPQVTVFTDQEIQTIKKIYTQAKNQGNHRVILKLAERISTVMEVVYTEKPIEFINNVIKDYTFYTRDI